MVKSDKKVRKLQFMIHKHHASKLHYDLRLEIGDVLKSWALYSLPVEPNKPVSAVLVADHPFWYRHFEGVIPEGQYGAGPVMVWDKGLYENFNVTPEGNKVTTEQALDDGCLLIWLEGKKLKGSYLLVRVSKKQRWLFIKMPDKYVWKGGRFPNWWHKSVKSGKTLAEILALGLKKNRQ